MMKLIVIAIIACLVTVECKREKQPKAVKQLKGLCDAFNSSTIVVKDEAFEEVFEDLDDFCDNLWESLDDEPSGAGKKIDGISILKKVCKYYEKKFDTPATEGVFVGMDTICNATEDAKAMSLNDKDSRKMMKKLNGLCVAVGEGNVDIKNENLTAAFAVVEDFCEAFLDETEENIVEVKRKGALDGEKAIVQICVWFDGKFGGITVPYDNLQDLEDVCDEVSDALGEESEESEEEEGEEETEDGKSEKSEESEESESDEGNGDGTDGNDGNIP